MSNLIEGDLQMKALGIIGLCTFAMGLVAFAPSTAVAGECVSGNCGTPTQSGGGCGCGCGCSILVAETDRGVTYQFADDQDGDGVEDDFDNCAFISNFDQSDADGDQVGDSCDNCAASANALQGDVNLNGIGDACDTDADGDQIPNTTDNCALVPNPSQANNDGDTEGDICDTDDDNDGILDTQDGCRLIAGTAASSACDDDPDADGKINNNDNCPEATNGDQSDIDHDGVGDACDNDADGDGRENFRDNCVYVANAGQVDADNDGAGDAGNYNTNGQYESCDNKECFVVDRAAYATMSQSEQAASCLDPSHAFEIRLALSGSNDPSHLVEGDVIEVRVFSNRLESVTHWTATFSTQPAGSNSTLDNAQGSSGVFPGTFQVGNDPRYSTIKFKADKAGEYRVKVTAELVGGDPLGLPISSHTEEIKAEVGEGSGDSSGGCSSTQAEGSLAALAIGLSIAAVLRRRKA